MFKILLTGFEPFDQNQVNSSWQALSRLENYDRKTRLIKIELPVVFEQAAGLLKEAVDQYRPDWVICTGAASGRSQISLEACALNVRHASRPDNAGCMPVWQKNVRKGPGSLFTETELPEILKRLQERKIPAEISFHAGTYVCNDVYYQALKQMEGRALFVHIPACEGMNSSVKLPVCLSSEALETVCRFVTDHLNSLQAEGVPGGIQ